MADPIAGSQPATSDIDKFASWIQREWDVFTAAPFLFTASVIVLGGVIWLFIRYIYRVQIDGYKTQVGAAKERLLLAEAKLNDAIGTRERLEQQVTTISVASDLVAIGDPEANNVVVETSAAAKESLVDLKTAEAEIRDHFLRVFADLTSRPDPNNDEPSNVIRPKPNQIKRLRDRRKD